MKWFKKLIAKAAFEALDEYPLPPIIIEIDQPVDVKHPIVVKITNCTMGRVSIVEKNRKDKVDS